MVHALSELAQSLLDQGKRCTTSRGTPLDTPKGYVVSFGAGSRRWRDPAGRSEELPGPRPGGRAADAAPGCIIEHEKPVAPWGIRPRSHCFPTSARPPDSRARRLSSSLGSPCWARRDARRDRRRPQSAVLATSFRLVAKSLSHGIESRARSCSITRPIGFPLHCRQVLAAIEKDISNDDS